MRVTVRRYDPASDEAAATRLLDGIGGRWQVRRGELQDVLAPGLGIVALEGDHVVGVLTWRPERDADVVELSVLIAEPRGGGTGTALIAALAAEMVANGRHRIRVVTTNDNIDALRFYQRRGFRLVELRPGAVDVARATLKPGIPAIGGHGIPLRDELELELDVDTDPGEPSRV